MIIDKRLNLVIPIVRADKTLMYIHSTPIMRETFEKYYLVLAKTYSAMTANGLDVVSAPSVAAMMLKDVAKSTPRTQGQDWWDGDDGVGGNGGLMAEMIRLSNAIIPGKDGAWAPIPFRTALDQKLIDEEEKSEVLSLLTFFMVASAVAPRGDRVRLVEGEAACYNLRTSYSNSTEYVNFLRTPTPDANTGEKSLAAS